MLLEFSITGKFWKIISYLETIENKNNSAIIFNTLNDNKIRAYILFLK